MKRSSNPLRDAARELMRDRRLFIGALSYLDAEKPNHAVDELYKAAARMQERGSVGSAMKVEALAFNLDRGDVSVDSAKQQIGRGVIPKIDQVLHMLFLMSGGSAGGPQFGP